MDSKQDLSKPFAFVILFLLTEKCEFAFFLMFHPLSSNVSKFIVGIVLPRSTIAAARRHTRAVQCPRVQKPSSFTCQTCGVALPQSMTGTALLSTTKSNCTGNRRPSLELTPTRMNHMYKNIIIFHFQLFRNLDFRDADGVIPYFTVSRYLS